MAASEPPLSDEVDGYAAGIIPDITKLLFSLVPEYQVTFQVIPWARAQLYVEEGLADGFLTYASEKRQRYAVFTDTIATTLDYGYLIYHKDNERRLELEEARSFEELKPFKAIVQTGAEWEEDNIPAFIERVQANNLDIMTHLLFLRREGDFLIMPPSQAVYYAKKFGYHQMIAYRRASFINDAEIPFKIGVRKSLKNSRQIINILDKAMSSREYKLGVQKIIDRYR